MLNGLSLFSGIGGIDVALSEYVRPIAYCEIDPYCQGVLLSRMESNDLSVAPIWDNILTFDARNIHARIDIIYGGFPCQDISVAGLGKGLAGERSGLFFEIVRLAKEIVPKWIFLENVPAITSRGGIQVLEELAKMGYDARWLVISAASVGALHRRERFFLLAHAKHDGALACEGRGGFGECVTPWEESKQQEEGFGKTKRTGGLSSDVANTEGTRCDYNRRGTCGVQATQLGTSSNGEIDGNTDSKPSQQADSCTESNKSERIARRGSTGQHWPFESREHWQEIVSGMGRCVDGISAKLDYNTQRLRALGNAVVPCQVKEAFKILMGIKK